MIGWLILGFIISILALVGFMILYTFFQFSKPPANTPSEFLKHGDQITHRKKVVLIGDSITHGRVGSNYVEILSRWDKRGDFEFINAGINGDLVWNVIQRLDEIAECKPDVITVLIGTNDANASLSPEGQQRYVKRKNLPTLPTHEWFRIMFTELLSELTKRTNSHIAVLSIPPIGEDFDSREFKQSQMYSDAIKEIALEFEIDYLPLCEMLIGNSESIPSKKEYSSRGSEVEMLKATMRYYLLREAWDSISERIGLKYHIDYLHLNTQGANLIAELIQQFLDNILQSGDAI